MGLNVQTKNAVINPSIANSNISTTTNMNTQPASTDNKPKINQQAVLNPPSDIGAKDLFNKSSDENTEKTTPKPDGQVQRFKNFVAGFKKVFVNVGEYSGALAFGTLYGLTAGLVLRTGIKGYEMIKNAPHFIKTIKCDPSMNLVKHWKKSAALWVPVALSLVYSLYNASLHVSKRTAHIDHKYNTGHRKED